MLRADIVVQWGTAGQAAIVQAGFKNTGLVINITQPLFKWSTVADNPAHLIFRQNLRNTFTISSKILLLFAESILLCLFVCYRPVANNMNDQPENLVRFSHAIAIFRMVHKNK